MCCCRLLRTTGPLAKTCPRRLRSAPRRPYRVRQRNQDPPGQEEPLAQDPAGQRARQPALRRGDGPPPAGEPRARGLGTVELLREQPRGVDLEFRVAALNRAGLGSPSGVVTAVL